jgi:dihydropteroate synthase
MLRQEAQALGVVALDGIANPQEIASHLLVADDETLKRLGAVLESRGERTLGTAIRTALAGYHRSGFSIPFADGERMDLAAETRVMGILNVTPDSFSDGGRFPDPSSVLRAANKMATDGADIIDVGGESTRPGAQPVEEDEEIRRVVPVVTALRREMSIRICVDTMKGRVAKAAIDAGADMVNDVSALADPAMARVIRDARVPLVVMHMRGTPSTMQQDTRYVDLMSSIVGFLRKAVEKATASGIADDKILVDPGLGFGKSVAGNLQILRELPTLRSIGRAILVGASRKSFIGMVLDLPVAKRLEGSLAVAALAAWQGVHVVRTHDVSATKRAVKTIDAIRKT